ncbi:hypothetical protein KAR50_04725 [Periweissella fabaria]|uniref:Uncharacterized protein n=1 Tax=Periweissella fabaria TaxID=546157 RepID=A0ABN8BH85_9LACO|nr:hypothetical protein [Periweissella fabaria]MCM0597142.1 hypothetical protein [Periweissella fabaria]CAH0417073.1 hypothetical protein WFA24289_01390 [Periweissella fabaria]
MDLSEFSQKFGAEAAPNYRFRGEPFNLSFTRYENGNWCVNLAEVTDDNDQLTLANEVTVPLKSKIADDFIALASNQGEYIKFFLNNNIIVKHPFFMEKTGQPGEIRPLVNETYQLTPDFIAFVEQQSGYNMTDQRDVTVSFVVERPTSGFTRLIFDRDAQLRENPDLGMADGGSGQRRNSEQTANGAASMEDQLTASEILDELTYPIDGNDVPVELNVKRYAVDGNWYVDIRTRDTQETLCILTDHGPKLSSRYQLHVNLQENQAIGDQVTQAWLQATKLFKQINVSERKAELNSVGLLVLEGQV